MASSEGCFALPPSGCLRRSVRHWQPPGPTCFCYNIPKSQRVRLGGAGGSSGLGRDRHRLCQRTGGGRRVPMLGHANFDIFLCVCLSSSTYNLTSLWRCLRNVNKPCWNFITARQLALVFWIQMMCSCILALLSLSPTQQTAA